MPLCTQSTISGSTVLMLLIPIWAAPGTRAISDPFCTFIAVEVQQRPSNWEVLFWFQKLFPQRKALPDAWKPFILVTFYSLTSKVCQSISCPKGRRDWLPPLRALSLGQSSPSGSEGQCFWASGIAFGVWVRFYGDLTLDQCTAGAVAWTPFFLGSSSWGQLQTSPPFLALSALNYKKKGSDEMSCKCCQELFFYSSRKWLFHWPSTSA